MTFAPGSTIGIIGGGQLGRMLAMAAAQLGYRCHIFDPHEHPPRPMSRPATPAPRSTTPTRSTRSPTRSTSRPTSSRICRSRRSRCSATSCGPARARSPSPRTARARKSFIEQLRRARRAVARGRRPRRRRRRGRRARRCRSCSRPAASAMTARARPGSARAGRGATPPGTRSARSRRSPKPAVDFVAEFSVIVARWADGRHAFWDSPAERAWRRHPPPLDRARAATPSRSQVAEAREAALRIAEALGHVGVLTVEFFATRRRPDGQRDRAARPQQRPLDDRGRGHLAVRAAHPRDLRPAARLDRARRRAAR